MTWGLLFLLGALGLLASLGLGVWVGWDLRKWWEQVEKTQPRREWWDR